VDHVEVNRSYWNEHAAEWVAAGERSWAQQEPTWGVWDVPESELRLLPEEMEDLDAVELGCGTAYVSAWMARRGAQPVGVDVSEGQLATARRLQREHGLDFPPVHASAEQVPRPDASFDFAISEYGWGALRARGAAPLSPAQPRSAPRSPAQPRAAPRSPAQARSGPRGGDAVEGVKRVVAREDPDEAPLVRDQDRPGALVDHVRGDVGEQGVRRHDDGRRDHDHVDARLLQAEAPEAACDVDVALAQDADEPSLLEHREVPDVALAHELRGVGDGGAGLHRDGVRRHVLLHGRR
jgi:SAM-dependent methyltransferase